MKRKQLIALMMALSMSTALVGCTIPGLQVLDGDGMEYQGPVTQNPDPVKDPEADNNGGDTENNGGDTENNGSDDNGENGEDQKISAEENDAILEAFLKNETKAHFKGMISTEDDYYTFADLVKAEGDYLINEYFGGAYEEDLDYSYEDEDYYAYIDCGADGVKDLGIKIYYKIDLGGGNNQTLEDHYILMVLDGKLECVASARDYYRSRGEFNEYGYIFDGGSGGAALYYESYSFVNSDGELLSDYNRTVHFGNAKPQVSPYELPESIRNDAPAEEYTGDGENYYNTYVYNITPAPEYPNLEYENYELTSESQKLNDEYTEKYNEWLWDNFFVFTDSDDNDVEIPEDLEKFLDDNNVSRYKFSEAEKIVAEHEKEIGLTDKIKNGKDPDWQRFNGHRSEAYDSIEELFIGEYVDENNDPNLQIAKGDDGKFIIQIGIFRLCFMDDGEGEIIDDRMEFVISDESGNPCHGTIDVDEEGTATITFTASTWEFIKDGETYVYKKVSDTPNLFVPVY